MRFFFPFTPLRDRADEGEGSSRIDPGAPHFHTTDPEPAKPAEKSDVEKRIEALEKSHKEETERLRRELGEERENARQWSEMARKRTATPEPEGDDDEENRLPVRPAAEEKPEKLLDDLSTQGLKALAERGVITQEQLIEALANQEKRFNARLTEAQDGAAFDQKLAKEFPDLTDPKSDLFKKAQVHFREMVEVDPRAKNSRSALWAAAKMAKNEIAAEAATKNNQNQNREDSETRRRERIDRQRGERDNSRGNEDDNPRLTETQRQIIKNLGVSEEQFSQYAEQGRNGRGR